MNIKKHIPNFITILNLVCGVFAILFFIKSVYGAGRGGCLGSTNIELIASGMFLIFIAAILDFLDGFAAKLLKVQSEIGAQLDSLADMVTFGVAPGFLFFATMEVILYFHYDENLIVIQLLFILIPIFSALRLAKFNLDTEQTTYFKGLATPANAIFWIGISYAILYLSKFHNDIMPQISLYLSYLMLILVITLSLLMVSNFKMFSLKVSNLKLEGDNIYRVVLIGLVIITGILCSLLANIFFAIPIIIILYILLSIPYHLNHNKK
jgi:CDP-diacylglycerol--serine O-phosphatidyltransferase